jgi:hypothetical protein
MPRLFALDLPIAAGQKKKLCPKSESQIAMFSHERHSSNKRSVINHYSNFLPDEGRIVA